MDDLTIANFFTVALATGFGVAMINGLIHGYTGFGGALLTVPVLTFLYGPVEAIGMVGIISLIGATQLVRETAGQAQWRAAGGSSGCGRCHSATAGVRACSASLLRGGPLWECWPSALRHRGRGPALGALVSGWARLRGLDLSSVFLTDNIWLHFE